jgi:hypothetical protein
MPRGPQGPAVKGSQKWIQKLVDQEPDLLASLIRTLFEGLPNRAMKPARNYVSVL